jgi:hypothetical protein
MNRRTAFALLAGLLFCLASLPALAVGTTFQDTILRYYTENNLDYLRIFEDGSFSDQFQPTVKDILVTSVDLQLEFSGTKTENWWAIYINGVSGEKFKLSDADDFDWRTQNFSFSIDELKTLLSDFDPTNLFTLTFTEKTGRKDDFFYLKSASVTYNYQSVPIPGAAMLLGPVLLGLVAFRRKHAA